MYFCILIFDISIPICISLSIVFIIQPSLAVISEAINQ